VDDPEQVDQVLGQACAQPGPALVEALVGPNAPPLPGNITIRQAWNFAKALVRGKKDR
jgi:pyruvate dehydrogenase (quinone)